MKKILYTLLSISILIVSLAIAGCGSEGDKYLGTWELKTENNMGHYYVIEKGDNSDSYLVTYYYVDLQSKKINVNSKKSGKIDNGILISDGIKYILKDGNIITNNGKFTLIKISDKPMTANKILETLK